MKKLIVILSFGILIMGSGVFYSQIIKGLPDVESLKQVQLQTPLRVYSSDEKLMAEFGKKRRKPVALIGVPKLFTTAFIAAEDASFFSHSGVDWMAMGRAAIQYLKTGEKRQGGSTITMQVARNFFLSSEKTFVRKFRELVLASIIEQKLSKNEILELYLNKIFLGHRAYGIGAAAQVYYGKEIADLDLAQMAMIAGLPKAPSRMNPISNPQAAKKRRLYVLNRMKKLGYISRKEFDVAAMSAVTAKWHGYSSEVSAPYVAEMVREFMVKRFGEKSYEEGFEVITTIKSNLQKKAQNSLQRGLIEYDRRHGYRGAEGAMVIGDHAVISESLLAESLRPFSKVRGLIPGIVTSVEDEKLLVWTQDYGEVLLSEDSLQEARPYQTADARGSVPDSFLGIFSEGQIIRVRKKNVPKEEITLLDSVEWQLSQLPEVEGALVSLNPKNGAILSLAGGLDFKKSKFNRVTQAKRQVGSNFKPFLYSAALEKGYTAASIINDAPIVFKTNNALGTWRPENFSGKFYGPTRLRQALTRSQNMVSVRLLDSIGIDYVIDYVSRFGIEKTQVPRDLSLALGSGEMTPLEVATGYSVFANGGFAVNPYFVQLVKNRDGEVIYEASPETVCNICESVVLDDEGEPADLESLMAMEELPPDSIAKRVITGENSWLIASMLRDVIKLGTGRRAKVIGKKDLSGKTGTTNEQRDAWFSGFSSQVATTVWVGFDKVAPLGRRETGAKAALPIWVSFMTDALANLEDNIPERPNGLVVVRIDRKSGKLSSVGNPSSVFEVFREPNVPTRERDSDYSSSEEDGQKGAIKPEQIF
tara:strand:+ start:1014 stop:3461 length:2448 start_codon:yes stop_codon:yes gene_type:complete